MKNPVNNRDALGLYLRRLRARVTSPSEFLLYLTNDCNLSCSMCTQWSEFITRDRTANLPARVWISFIKSIAALRPRLVLFGGEPLIYPDVDVVIRTGHALGCRVALVTNGYYLRDHFGCIADNAVQTTISIDGTRDIHNSIRNSEDSFDRITDFLVERRESARGKMPSVFINLVMLPDNVHNLLEFIDFIQAFQPAAITFQHPQFFCPEIDELNNLVWQERLGVACRTKFRNRKAYDFNDDYVDRLRAIINTIATRRDCQNVFFFPKLDDNEIIEYYSKSGHGTLRPELVCLKPWRRPTITASGEVMLCLDYSIGNIMRDDFNDIWNGETANRLRSELRQLERFPMCMRCCDLYNTYGGGASRRRRRN